MADKSSQIDWSDPELKAQIRDYACLAATVANTPVALISTSGPDQDQIVGSWRWAIESLPRERSLGHRIVDTGEPLVIEDMKADPELASHPLTAEQPFIRFAAGFPVVDASGTPIAAVQVLDQQPRGLTEQQREGLQTIATMIARATSPGIALAEDAPSESAEERVRELFESLDDLILTMFDDGRIFSMNKAGAEHLGFFEKDEQPESLYDLVAHDHVEEMRSSFDGVVKRGVKQPVQTTLVSAYNKRVIVEGTLTPQVEDGVTRFVRVIFRDVTDRIATERELGRQKDAALEAARAKSSFLTNLSHEIRTPMNIVIGMLDLLIGTDLDAEQKDLAETALSNAESFLTTIDNLLHVSKLESGNLTVMEADFDPTSAVTRLVDVSNIMAADRGIEIKLDIDPKMPLVLRGDVARVRQVLGNLVSNAVKFNRDTDVTVSAQVKEETPTHIMVRFEVRDQGIGIAEDQLDKIFDPFTQVDTTMTRESGGAGVGLTTAKQLVELMGGAIGVTSSLGKGSTFWFTVPFRRVTSDDMSVTARKQGFPGLKALVLDRSETSGKIIEHHFRDWGVVPRMETSEKNALDRLNSQASLGEPYDIFFFDYRLESGDAFDLARKIRADQNLDHTRLVTMIPLGESLDDARLRDSGLSGYLNKPVEQWELFDKISSALATRIDVTGARANAHSSPTRAEAPARPAVPEGSIEGLRVLLAEDKPLNQKLALSQLKGLGLSADVVENGQQVLDALEEQDYDVILMDCQMPVLDGYEATVRLRQNEAGGNKHVHVIALTAHAVEGEREKCLASGMDDYLSKPTKQNELAEALAKAKKAAG